MKSRFKRGGTYLLTLNHFDPLDFLGAKSTDLEGESAQNRDGTKPFFNKILSSSKSTKHTASFCTIIKKPMEALPVF